MSNFRVNNVANPKKIKALYICYNTYTEAWTDVKTLYTFIYTQYDKATIGLLLEAVSFIAPQHAWGGSNQSTTQPIIVDWIVCNYLACCRFDTLNRSHILSFNLYYRIRTNSIDYTQRQISISLKLLHLLILGGLLWRLYIIAYSS